MRSPRRIDPSLLAALPGDVTPPPPDALFWTMWKANLDVASGAFNTGFVQGIGTGTLDPVLYGGFNVNDAYYCFNGADDYGVAAGRASDSGLKAYLQAKQQSYNTYNQTFPTVWHVKDATSVVPFPVCVQYSQFESEVASDQALDAIYALIVMIPCEYLWSYLAQQLVPESPPGNLYQPWIDDNQDESGAFKMGNFLYAYMQQYPNAVDPDTADELYRIAMTYEFENFQAGDPPPS